MDTTRTRIFRLCRENRKARNLPIPSARIGRRLTVREAEQREHPAGATFFGPIGIVGVQIAGRANAAVMNLVQACSLTLSNDIRSEIDLVMGRTNARAELAVRILGWDENFLWNCCDP